MKQDSPPSNSGEKASRPPQRRINTQIHRRKKAKAVPPLTDEWESTSTSPPTNLRMPPSNMGKG